METLPVAEVLRQNYACHLWQPAHDEGDAQEGHQPGESHFLLGSGYQRIDERSIPLGVIQRAGDGEVARNNPQDQHRAWDERFEFQTKFN